MPRIVTITLNTAIDNIVEIGEFKLGSVVKGDSYLTQSGKGINVARATSSLGLETLALGFVGRPDYDFFKEVDSSLLSIGLSPVDGKTRMNISLLDVNHNLIIHTRTKGYLLTAKVINLFIANLRSIISSKDIMIISGSIPNAQVSNAYFKIIQAGKRAGALVILDASGPELVKGLEAKPDVIKPNLEELQTIVSKELSSENEIVAAAKQLNLRGITKVFVSMGSKGVILTEMNTDGYWKAQIKERLTHFTGMEIGCGDSMVAGIAFELSRSAGINQLLQSAVGCGTANLFAKSPGQISKSVVAKYRKQVMIEHIK